jgi:integrase
MRNKVKIRRRGKLKYFAIEIPREFREPDERRPEIMATTRDELNQKYEDAIERRRRKLDRDGGKLTVRQFFEAKFLPFYKTEGGIEPQTWNDYRFHAENNIVPLLGNVPLEELTARAVDHWTAQLRSRVSERTGKQLSDRTIDYAYAVLRRALQFAVDWRYIAVNPASARSRAAKRRKRVTATKLRHFTPDQARHFQAAVQGNRYEALYILAITTGMREGELFGLKWPDINIDKSRVTVNNALTHTKRKKGEDGERFHLKGPKTQGSRRTIDIPEIAVVALRKHATLQDELRALAGDEWTEQGYVFASRLGTPLDCSNAYIAFRRSAKTMDSPKFASTIFVTHTRPF